MIFPDLTDPRLWPIYGFAVLVALPVLVFGGKPERYLLGVVVLMLPLQLLLLNYLGRWQVFQTVDGTSVATDLIGLAGITVIMLYADRVWTIFAFGLQLIAVLGHFLHSVVFLERYSYVTFKTWPTMLIIPLILLGTILYQLRKRSGGTVRDWYPYKKMAEFRRIARETEL